MALNKENGNTLWFDAIKKELQCMNDCSAFKMLEKGEKPPSGCQCVPCHFPFVVKFMGGRQAQLVCGGNWTSCSKDEVYSGIVDMETVRMALFLGELNDLKVITGDTSSSCLHGVKGKDLHHC